MERKLLLGLFLMAFLIIGLSGFSQLSLSGPSCVTPGIVYMYNVNGGSWSSTSTMNICVTGGVVADSGSACISGKYFSFIRVTWNDNSTGGSISLTSSLGNTSKNVNITAALQGGLIIDSSQTINHVSLPSVIHCTAASGGNCSPVYSYQWQQSADQLSWTEISGATGQNLSFSNGLAETTYYRRMVTEMGSGSVEYSSVSAIAVNPAMSNGN